MGASPFSLNNTQWDYEEAAECETHSVGITAMLCTSSSDSWALAAPDARAVTGEHASGDDASEIRTQRVWLTDVATTVNYYYARGEEDPTLAPLRPHLERFSQIIIIVIMMIIFLNISSLHIVLPTTTRW